MKVFPIYLFLFVCTYAVTFSLELKPLKTFYGAGAPKSVVVSPDGKLAAVMNLEGLNFWVIDTQKLIIREKVQFKGTKAMGWDYKNKRPFPSLAEKPVECDFTENGKYLWVSFHNGASVVRYDTSGNNSNCIDKMNATSIQKAFVSDYVNNINYSIELPKIKVGKTPKVIKATPDGRYVLVANWHSSSVSIIDTATLVNVKDVKLGGKYNYIPRGIAVSADSKTAYVANMGGGTISIIDLEEMKVVRDIAVSPNPRHIVLSKDQKYLYISENARGEVLKFNIERGKVEKRVSVGSQARTIDLTPDEKYIFVAVHYSSKLSVIDSETFKVVKSVDFERPMGVSVSPDGKQLWVTSYQGGYVRVYEIIE